MDDNASEWWSNLSEIQNKRWESSDAGVQVQNPKIEPNAAFIIDI